MGNEVKSNPAASTAGCWYQDVTVKKGETYTFSGYVKTDITTVGSGGFMNLRIRAADSAGSYIWGESHKLKDTTGNFVKLSTTLKVPEDSANDKVRVFVYLHNTQGTMYADMLQLEPGSTPGRCNLVDTGNFYHGSTAGSGFTGSGTTVEDELVQTGEDQYRVMKGTLTTVSSAGMFQEPSTSATKLATLAKGTHICAVNI